MRSFSAAWGGLKGARPMVRQRRRTTPHEIFAKKFIELDPFPVKEEGGKAMVGQEW
jgi:hypothetical protein